MPKLGSIKPNVYNKLTWIIGEKHFAVIINGEVRYCLMNMPYMNMDLRLQPAFPVIIGSNGQGKKYFKSVSVSKLRHIPKEKINGGKFILDTKLSNNTISNIHQVVTFHYGENYWFNGCAKYVMECLNEPDFDYEFFAGITGDNFSQIYFKDHFYGDSATDYLIGSNGGTYIEKIFNEIGYACTYVPNKRIKENREMYLQTLMAYIDKGVPVIRYHWIWSVIVGYEDFGKTLLVMSADKTEPERIPLDKFFDYPIDISDEAVADYGYGWFFIGEKLYDIKLNQIYRNAIQNLVKKLTINNEKYCFGAEAFREWSADLKSDKYDNMKPEDFDEWCMYKCFVCNLATNSCCGIDFLKKAQELNPDLEFISDIIDIYKHTGELWNNQNGKDLEALGGGFNTTIDTLKNKEKRLMIADKLLEFADCIDNAIAILKSHLDENGILK